MRSLVFLACLTACAPAEPEEFEPIYGYLGPEYICSVTSQEGAMFTLDNGDVFIEETGRTCDYRAWRVIQDALSDGATP